MPTGRPTGRPGSARGQQRWTTPNASPTRAKIETASQNLLTRIASWPRWLTFLALLALAVTGALAPVALGVIFLVILAALLGWLLYLAWPALDQRARIPRMLAVGVLLGAAVLRIFVG